jgi:DNA-binding transcriptional regulator YdaS (Cro superfamily)
MKASCCLEIIKELAYFTRRRSKKAVERGARVSDECKGAAQVEGTSDMAVEDISNNQVTPNGVRVELLWESFYAAVCEIAKEEVRDVQGASSR